MQDYLKIVRLKFNPVPTTNLGLQTLVKSSLFYLDNCDSLSHNYALKSAHAGKNIMKISLEASNYGISPEMIVCVD